MHWIIHEELRKFAELNFGPGAWESLLADAGLAHKSYLSKQEYPDADAAQIAAAAARKAGAPLSEVLESFGEFLVPDYIKFYGMLVRPDWKTLETILNTESMIHAILRVRDPNVKPPELRVRRVSPEEVVLTYDSARKMCGVAKGIARGLAKHHREELEIQERACMSAGAKACEISFVVRRAKAR